MKKSFYLLATLIVISCAGSEGMHSSKEELVKKREDAIIKRAALEMDCPSDKIKIDILEDIYLLEMNGSGTSKYMAKGCKKTQIYNTACADKMSIGAVYVSTFTLGLATPSTYTCTVSKEAS